MMKLKKLYPALLRQMQDENVEIIYPDFPACSGRIAEEKAALEEAKSILAEHVEELRQIGDGSLPAPSQLSQIKLRSEESLIFVTIASS